jgi:hypothetical protein
MKGFYPHELYSLQADISPYMSIELAKSSLTLKVAREMDKEME